MSTITRNTPKLPVEKEVPAPKPRWRNRNPFSLAGPIASWCCMSWSSRKLANEARTLRKRGNLAGAFVKFQLAAFKQKYWRSAAKLHEMAGDVMFEIADREIDPVMKKNSLRDAAEEYRAAAMHMKDHNPKRASEIYALAKDIYEKSNSLAVNGNGAPPALPNNPESGRTAARGQVQAEELTPEATALMYMKMAVKNERIGNINGALKDCREALKTIDKNGVDNPELRQGIENRIRRLENPERNRIEEVLY